MATITIMMCMITTALVIQLVCHSVTKTTIITVVFTIIHLVWYVMNPLKVSCFVCELYFN